MANEKRLIYADEVVELINGLESLPWEEETEDLVNSLTTVDAVEVVHGHWAIINENCCVCSACHKHSIQDYYYCPNCGAKMDGDGNA